MALTKIVPNEYGTKTAYWKISQINVNWLYKHCQVAVQGWIDKSSRDNLNKPTSTVFYELNGINFPFIEAEPQNEREILYSFIKIQPEFEGSEDC